MPKSKKEPQRIGNVLEQNVHDLGVVERADERHGRLESAVHRGKHRDAARRSKGGNGRGSVLLEGADEAGEAGSLGGRREVHRDPARLSLVFQRVAEPRRNARENLGDHVDVPARRGSESVRRPSQARAVRASHKFWYWVAMDEVTFMVGPTQVTCCGIEPIDELLPDDMLPPVMKTPTCDWLPAARAR